VQKKKGRARDERGDDVVIEKTLSAFILQVPCIAFVLSKGELKIIASF